MTPKKNADHGERVAADDVIFEQGLIPPLPAAKAPPPPAAAPTEVGRDTSPGDNPLRDPLLELEQEFQDQEEEGKV